MPIPFAICEASDPNVLGYIAPLAAAALVVLLLVKVFSNTPRGLRPRLGAVLVGSVVAGGIIVSTPGGLSDPDGDYVARAATAMFVGAVGGFLAAGNHRRHGLRFALIGGLGGVAFIAALLGLLIAAIVGGGTCLG